MTEKVIEKSEITNIFVLDNTYDSRFSLPHLLETYLNYNSENEIDCTPFDYYKEREGVTTTKKIIRNKKFNFMTIKLNARHTSDPIASILLNFSERQKVTAIIFPIRIGLKEVDKHLLVYKNLLEQIKRFTGKNILYIFIHENQADEEANEKYKNTLEINENNNVFYFEQNICKGELKLEDNWRQNVITCNNVYNYIIGGESGLRDFYIQSLTESAVLKLADDLMELFILIYTCCKYSNLSCDEKYCYDFDLKNYKTNVTTCYGDNCFTWKKHPRNENVKMKLPKICGDPDDENTLFQTPDGNCSQCNCGIDSHSKNYFDYIVSCRYYNNEMQIAVNILATFLVYKNQQQQTYNIEGTFSKLLNMEDLMHQAVYENFKKDLDEEVTTLKNKLNAITGESVIIALRKLNFKDIDKLILNYMDDVFPSDFLVAQFAQQQSESSKDVEIKALETEVQRLKDDMEEMRIKLDEVLRLVKDNSPELSGEVSTSNVKSG